ncbi:hypothetical protein LSTR_LSTR012093 [Laodelphax striatellus]|uniref:VWFC domain-containing protein n=1 Tax=Laodelphax striatellus TaxID=195883 RepID=A0A482WKG6_LAOST|nr:hypothetical protein LSTR_LSTR012093 [Laodelphax striatellus]
MMVKKKKTKKKKKEEKREEEEEEEEKEKKKNKNNEKKEEQGEGGGGRGCTYAGRRYKNGAEVATAEKCLRCLCLSSNLVCRLRVCTEVPDPPPPSCILLQRANHCCPQLVCNQDQDLFATICMQSANTFSGVND